MGLPLGVVPVAFIVRGTGGSPSAIHSASLAGVWSAERTMEAARKAGREATETWIRVFAEVLGRQISETGDEVAQVLGEAPPPTISQGGETVESAQEATEAEAGLTPKTAGAAKETEAKQQAKENRKLIESRLDFLTRMYAASQDKAEVEEEKED